MSVLKNKYKQLFSIIRKMEIFYLPIHFNFSV